MPKLLFCDIDGTLLRSDGSISPYVREWLQTMANLGHGFILTSGRPLSSIQEVVRYIDIAFPYSYIIANNGGLIYDCNANRSILEERLPFSMISPLQSLAEAMKIHIQTYTETAIVCRNETAEVLSYADRIKMPIQYSNDLRAPLSVPPYKMLALSLKGSEALMPLKGRIESTYGDTLICMFSQDGYLEILPKKASKGNALFYLCQHLNIPVSDTYAAGDSDNDVAMLKAAGTSFAMKNGKESAKSSADYITALDHNHDGISEVIKLICS